MKIRNLAGDRAQGPVMPPVEIETMGCHLDHDLLTAMLTCENRTRRGQAPVPRRPASRMAGFRLICRQPG